MEILVVDDNQSLLRGLLTFLKQEGHSPTGAGTVSDAIKTLKARAFDLVITDLKLPDGVGLDVIRTAREAASPPEVILMTAFGSVDSAVEAMKLGAMDYLTKPVPIEELAFRVSRVAQMRTLKENADKMRRSKETLLEAVGYSAPLMGLVGDSPVMGEVKALITRAAAFPSTVLITGETGTGKEMAAYAIHSLSPWSDGPFVRVNCASIPETLYESELFGHEKGAFTDAKERRIGRFEAARGGTILLDEVGEIPLSMQAKLLRALQEKEIVRVGGNSPIKVDARVVAATNRDLNGMALAGTFREDLLYRLAVVRISIPPLRERREDIPDLVNHILKNLGWEFNRPPSIVSGSALSLLESQPWRGNVRELKNTLERAVVLSDSPILKEDNFGFAAQQGGKLSRSEFADKSLVDALETVEKEMIQNALQCHNGVKNRAAQQLGISRPNLVYRMKRLGIISGCDD